MFRTNLVISAAPADFVTRNDLLAHLSTLKSVYDHCINLDLEGIYNYLLLLEAEYFTNPAIGSYAALVHKLHPIKYTTDISEGFRGQSIRSQLICCYCSASLPLKDAFDLHVKKSSVQCRSCSRTFTYENHRVIAFKGILITEMNIVISAQIAFRRTRQNYDFRAQAYLLNLDDYACITYREMGDWFRAKVRLFFKAAYAANWLKMFSVQNIVISFTKAIWAGFVSCVKRYSQRGMSSLSVDLEGCSVN